MYQMIRDIMSYTGTGINNPDQYYIYGGIVLTVIGFVFFIDLLYRLLRSFIKK